MAKLLSRPLMCVIKWPYERKKTVSSSLGIIETTKEDTYTLRYFIIRKDTEDREQ